MPPPERARRGAGGQRDETRTRRGRGRSAAGGLWPLPFGPELAAAEEVEVQVVDGHARMVADVEGHAVAVLEDTLEARDLGGEREHPREHVAVHPLDVSSILDVLAWDDEVVHGRAGVDVADGEGVVVLSDAFDCDLARGHAAEEAIGHCCDLTAIRREVFTSMRKISAWVEPRRLTCFRCSGRL